MQLCRPRFIPLPLVPCLLLFCALLPLVRPASAQEGASSQKPTLPGRQVFLVPYNPFRLDLSKTQVVACTLNGTYRTHFFLDTGTNLPLIAADVVEKLHLTPVPRTDVHEMMDGAPETIVSTTLTFREFGFSLPLVVVDRFAHLSVAGPDIDGIIGARVLQTYATIFDFRKHVITFIDEGNLSATERTTLGFGGAEALPLQVVNGLYQVQVTLNNGYDFQQQTTHLLVDTGSDNTIISSEVAQALHLSPSGFTRTHSQFSPQKGPAPRFQTFSAPATLQLGNITLKTQMVQFPKDADAEVPTMLGLDVLSQFQVLVDFPANKMYLISALPDLPAPQAPPVIVAPAPPSVPIRP